MRPYKVTDKIKSEINNKLKEKKSMKKISAEMSLPLRLVFMVKNDISTYKRGKTVRADGVSESLYNDLENIAHNLGYNKLSQFIKKELPAIRDKYPANLRSKKH